MPIAYLSFSSTLAYLPITPESHDITQPSQNVHLECKARTYARVTYLIKASLKNSPLSYRLRGALDRGLAVFEPDDDNKLQEKNEN